MSLSASEQCYICFDDYQASTPKITLSCRHVICSKCVINIVTSSEHKCPVCRKEISLKEDSNDVNNPVVSLTKKLVDDAIENERIESLNNNYERLTRELPHVSLPSLRERPFRGYAIHYEPSLSERVEMFTSRYKELLILLLFSTYFIAIIVLLALK